MVVNLIVVRERSRNIFRACMIIVSLLDHIELIRLCKCEEDSRLLIFLYKVICVIFASMIVLCSHKGIMVGM